MINELEAILWAISDQALAGERCINALPAREEVDNDQISIIMGFAAMSMSKGLLEAAIEKYELVSEEFNIDIKYNGKTVIEWINDRRAQGHPEAQSMLTMMEALISFQNSKDCPLETPTFRIK
ncbi:hypothetical protein [Legionella sp. km772]|uniref:hypothetical protein n=1 Tax=Legionella sp. km772 TaxID=2498111 RepID=UPI000F8C8A20|nr:hypothetical protein [Legionella sp. km772]RUR12341.1 hypothetical protein ELY15_05455 [Legionella sp. km772]